MVYFTLFKYFYLPPPKEGVKFIYFLIRHYYSIIKLLMKTKSGVVNMTKTHDVNGKEIWVLEEDEFVYGENLDMVGKR